MRIPHTIPKNVFEAYRCSVETSLLPRERERVLRSEDVTWDENVIPELRILALRAIVSAWRDNPLLEELPSCADRDLLHETLPTDLPFELVIKRIVDEHYWERCVRSRWEFYNLDEHGNSWRQMYCERHLNEYLENLEASYFESQREECENAIQLVREHVRTIRLRRLVPTKKTSKWAEDEMEDECVIEEDVVHHIPMAIILPQFPYLEEIYLNFGMIYMDDGFEWRDFEFSVEDSVNLGEGIKLCPALKKFSLTRSNLDQPRVAAILQGMAKNESVQELNLSHCKLGDTGAQAVGEFLSMHQQLRVVHLANNNIGPSGSAGLVYGLLKRSSLLRHLDLRLNPLRDAGAAHICAILLRNESLEILNLSGCEITSEGGTSLAEVLSSGCVKNKSLDLDVSNNDLGPISGEAFEIAMKSCPSVIRFDGRMCNFSKESEYSISESVFRNKNEKKRERARAMLTRASNIYASASAGDLRQQPEVDTTSGLEKSIVDRPMAAQILDDVHPR
ncbi:hypothetical protein KM043_018641 [Ampulex compressa]|nr:hypothetical protein KM043_018641 [Ampulex compressa]